MINRLIKWFNKNDIITDVHLESVVYEFTLSLCCYTDTTILLFTVHAWKCRVFRDWVVFVLDFFEIVWFILLKKKFLILLALLLSIRILQTLKKGWLFTKKQNTRKKTGIFSLNNTHTLQFRTISINSYAIDTLIMIDILKN